jgi:hypothetical protein
MAATDLLATAALGFRVRGRRQPSFSVSICRVAVIGASSIKARIQGTDVVGKQRNSKILVYLPVTYVPGGILGDMHHRMPSQNLGGPD